MAQDAALRAAAVVRKEEDQRVVQAAAFPQMGDQAADVVRRGREIDDRKAELDRVTMALGNALFKIPAMNKLVFAAAEKRMDAAEFLLDDVDMTKWHEYKIEWRAEHARFSVDAVEMFRANNPPNVPLGFVAWIDNNATTMGPGKEFSFSRIAVAEREWMELAYVKIERHA